MTMKIFLTEMTKDGKTFAGPNIVAESIEEAEEAAESNNLTLLCLLYTSPSPRDS